MNLDMIAIVVLFSISTFKSMNNKRRHIECNHRGQKKCAFIRIIAKQAEGFNGLKNNADFMYTKEWKAMHSMQKPVGS